jgi:uncharacterized RDD family membrane protein YckC
MDRNYWDGTQWTARPEELQTIDPWLRAPQLTCAGFWIRALAYLIDMVVLIVPTGLLVLLQVQHPVAASDAPPTPGELALAVAQLLGVLLTAVYFVFCWSRGGTLGMRVLGLGVVHAETGERISVVRAILRYVGYVVGAAFCYLGWLWVAFDDDKQAWHDKMANTLVVYL